MKFKKIPGHKNNDPDDYIILGLTEDNMGFPGWDAVTFEDMFNWIRLKGPIEDLHYPLPKYKGRYKILQFVQDVLKMENGRWKYSMEDLKTKHNIPNRQ